MRWILLSVAGAVGTMARYSVYLASQRVSQATGFPLATLLVNVVGCFLMGLISALVLAKVSSADLRLVAGVGFLGAFTTFSTFALDMVGLLEQRAYDRWALYAGGNLLIGLLAVLLGRELAHRFNR